MPRPARAAAAPVLLALVLAVPGAAGAADAAHPEVIELFQSQGCSSCPPANAAVMALTANRPDLLMLSWQVTYWDRLGWKDTFGDPAFTARQHDYAAAWGRENVFTPEVVVNGRTDLVGNDPGELAAVVARADRGAGGPAIALVGGAVTVSGGGAAGPGGAATVLLVRYDPRVIEVPIGRGENGGRTLPHRDVVRAVTVLGSWSPGRTARFALPADTRPGLADAVLVQAGTGGPILAAARV
ncbi:MAG: DUF1223 domain-containing protein [Gluconacetobacter diazotrophicus]|nr:DUF1223 domain-containing protein [Gluconacetobacter diazotrophicus]